MWRSKLPSGQVSMTVLIAWSIWHWGGIMQQSDHLETALPSLPLWRKIMFALGQLGWSLASFGVGGLVMYFYVPPLVNGTPVFPTYVFPGLVFGVLTVIGLI